MRLQKSTRECFLNIWKTYF